MSKEINPVEQWAKLGNETLEAWKKLAELNTSLAEKIAKQQKAVLDQCLEASDKQMSLATESKDYRELFSAQAELVSQQSQKFVDLAREVAKVMEEARTDMSSWLESSVKEYWTPVTEATRSTKKAA